VYTFDASVSQKIARYALICALMLLGAWMLQHFLPALCWAGVLAIGTSKLYDHWLAYFRGKHRHIWAALTFTTIVGLVLIVPLIYGGIIAARPTGRPPSAPANTWAWLRPPFRPGRPWFNGPAC
jgi:predicted PurR-regulated permease PerM